MKNKGFTLIELLIVIALLGALAIGLLATIDPFEQLKKGRDTSTRNTAMEFYNGSIRYYGTKGVMPWGATTIPVAVSLTDAAMLTAIGNMTTLGELKSAFSNAAQNDLKKIFIFAAATDEMGLCFKPESKNFRVDPNTTYNVSGTQINGCGNATSSNCYWCITK
jgi:prepilin-type N-terminal cleavage/methylation domain-containing protein